MEENTQKDKVYVGNLPFSMDDSDLEEAFSKAGEVTEAVVISEKGSDRSKGFGFVTFASEEGAQKAVDEMNEAELEGRTIKVDFARPKNE